jgi:aspartate aminotransferase-like enzyme
MAAAQPVTEYKLGLVPGPTSVPAHIGAVYQRDYASSDLEDAFFESYADCQARLKQLLRCEEADDVVIMSGEAMVALWGALKSVLRPRMRVLAMGTGIYGNGIGEMARQLGADVHVVEFGNDAAVSEVGGRVRAVAQAFRPELITAVHCETPSGTLSPLAELGKLARELGALFYVDFVSSAFAADVRVGEWCIDLGLLGSQKALSLPPDLGVVTVSPRAWRVIEGVKYVGYDAILPFKTAVKDKYFPYTHNWRAVEALRVRLGDVAREGLEAVLARHAQVSAFCRAECKRLGLALWPRDEATSSPSVTALRVPAGWTWEELDRELRKRGVVFGGSYGAMSGKVFRIGHMGSQADQALVAAALRVLGEVLATRR